MVPTSALATRATLPATARPHVASATSAVRRGQAGVVRQVKEQRRGHTRAVLQSLAHTHRGRPGTDVATALPRALVPLGVHLSPVQLRELARHIEAGRPVELP
jgi:hypothetical protein